MPAYLCTWNPTKTDWPTFEEDAAKVQRGETPRFNWSVGNQTRIRAGDRLYLLRQGPDHPGLIACARASSDVFRETHWSDPGKVANYVSAELEWLVNPKQSDRYITRDELRKRFPQQTWDTQTSGITVLPEVAEALEEIIDDLKSLNSESEVPDASAYIRPHLFELDLGARYKLTSGHRESLGNLTLTPTGYRFTSDGSSVELNITEIWEDSETTVAGHAESLGEFTISVPPDPVQPRSNPSRSNATFSMAEDERRLVISRIREWASKPNLKVHKMIALVVRKKQISREDLVRETERLTGSANAYGAIASMMTTKGNAYGRVLIDVNGLVTIHPDVADEVQRHNWNLSA